MGHESYEANVRRRLLSAAAEDLLAGCKHAAGLLRERRVHVAAAPYGVDMLLTELDEAIRKTEGR